MTDDGNWEGVTILSRVRDDVALADMYGLSTSEVAERLADARARLLARRTERAQPARDDKALAAWNGLAIAALADAGRAFGEPRYVAAAARAAETIVGGLLGSDGVLGRSWKDGRASGNGVLEDYADLADGLLALYEATFDERWFTTAVALAERILARFADPAGGFFDTADDHERLVTRPKDVQDNAVPSGNAMATTVLLRLAALTGEGRYRDAAERAMRTVIPFVARYPTGFAQWLSAMDFALAPVVEIAIVGAPEDEGTRALVAVATAGFRPNQVLAVSPDPAASAIPLLADRVAVGGAPTAYVCRDFVCRLPVTDADVARRPSSRDHDPRGGGAAAGRDGRPAPSRPCRSRGAADAAPVIDGVRPGHARLPGWSRGRRRCRSRPRRPVRGDADGRGRRPGR